MPKVQPDILQDTSKIDGVLPETSLTTKNRMARRIQALYRGYISRKNSLFNAEYPWKKYTFTPFGNEFISDPALCIDPSDFKFSDTQRLTIVGTGYLPTLEYALLLFKKRIESDRQNVKGPKLIICEISQNVHDFWDVLKMVASKSKTWIDFCENALKHDALFKKHIRALPMVPFIDTFKRRFLYHNLEHRYSTFQQIIAMASIVPVNWISPTFAMDLAPFMPCKDTGKGTLVVYASNLYEYCKHFSCGNYNSSQSILKNIELLDPDFTIHTLTEFPTVLSVLNPKNIVWSRDNSPQTMKQVLDTARTEIKHVTLLDHQKSATQRASKKLKISSA